MASGSGALILPQTAARLLNTNTGPGSSLTNTVTETIISPSTDYSQNANTLFAGQILRISARGLLGYKATPAGTIRFRLRYGGIAGTALIDSNPTMATNGIQTGTLWVLDTILHVQSIGASGVAFASGINIIQGNVGGTPFNGGATTTIDTTANKTIVLTGAFGTADANNTIICQTFLIESL